MVMISFHGYSTRHDFRCTRATHFRTCREAQARWGLGSIQIRSDSKHRMMCQFLPMFLQSIHHSVHSAPRFKRVSMGSTFQMRSWIGNSARTAPCELNILVARTAHRIITTIFTVRCRGFDNRTIQRICRRDFYRFSTQKKASVRRAQSIHDVPHPLFFG